MILHDLFEGKMSELDIEYQDYKKMEPLAFYSRYKMTPDEWASKHWSLIKGSETVHEGAMKDLHTELADKYRELAPKIEKYKDSFLAGELYDALEAIAIKHNAELEFKRMLAGARNSAHMDYDTNPGGFQNWFWYLPFADDETDNELAEYTGTPMFGTPVKNLSPAMQATIQRRLNDKKSAEELRKKQNSQDVAEGSQQFGKHDPYWVCVNGKKWKRYETFEHARAVHDKLEKKFRDEGSDKKVSLLSADDVKEGLRDPKDNPCWKGYKPVGTKQKGGRTVPNCVPKE